MKTTLFAAVAALSFVSHSHAALPTPWLFVDLPGSSPFTFLDSKWFFNGVQQFQSSRTVAAGVDQFWLAPTDAVWDAKKALGRWRVDTRYSFGDILFAENGGIGVGITTATGSASVGFDVAPVPLPAGVALFGTALGMLGRRLRRGA